MNPADSARAAACTLWQARAQRAPLAPLNARFDLCGGDITCTLERIATVSIASIAEVAEHTVTRIARSTSHFIRFDTGALLRLAYSDAGELLELSAERVCVRLDHEGHIGFAPLRSAPTQAKGH